MRLYALLCGIERARFALIDPLDERAGEVVNSPEFLYVIDHPHGLALIDSGVNPELAAKLGDDISWSESDSVVGKLESIGATTSGVRCGLQTHLHYDHAGGLPSLPGIPVLIQANELGFAREPPVYQQLFYHAPDFLGDVRWQPITGEHDVFGDETVRLIPTPGHTPGHQSVLVTLAGGSILLGGDAHYSRQKMRERRVPGVVWNPDEMLASWIALEMIEQSARARLIVSHELGYLDEMELGPKCWYE